MKKNWIAALAALAVIGAAVAGAAGSVAPDGGGAGVPTCSRGVSGPQAVRHSVRARMVR